MAGNGTLSGSDQIDLRDVKYSSVQDSFAHGVLTVTDGSDAAKLTFNGSYTLANFKFASDGNGGTIVYDPPIPSASQGSSDTADRASSGESSIGGNIALFASYIASTFATISHSGAIEIAEPVQSGQTLLTIPKHTWIKRLLNCERRWLRGLGVYRRQADSWVWLFIPAPTNGFRGYRFYHSSPEFFYNAFASRPI